MEEPGLFLPPDKRVKVWSFIKAQCSECIHCVDVCSAEQRRRNTKLYHLQRAARQTGRFKTRRRGAEGEKTGWLENRKQARRRRDRDTRGRETLRGLRRDCRLCRDLDRQTGFRSEGSVSLLRWFLDCLGSWFSLSETSWQFPSLCVWHHFPLKCWFQPLSWLSLFFFLHLSFFKCSVIFPCIISH